MTPKINGTDGSTLSILEQCRVLELPRSTYYAKLSSAESRQQRKEEEHRIRTERAEIVLDEWLGHSIYGYKKMSKHLKRLGYDWAGEKMIRILYHELGIKGQKPVFRTTRPGKRPYGKFPYLLRNRTARFVNEIWATDITYISTPNGMMYYTAIIDLFSRKILSWRLSDTMKVDFCIECVREAIERYGLPAIFNTDCGSQYTSGTFVDLLLSYGIRISMDGVGRCKDNIFVERTWRTLKYEWIFLRDYSSEQELRDSLEEFVRFFNNERIHQSLDYNTPDEVYEQGTFPTTGKGIERKQVA